MSFLTTADKYFLKTILKHLSSITVLLISVVWLSQSLRFLELIVSNNIDIKSYLLLIIFLLPDLFSILFPICLLISGAHIYQKLISDHEITVLRSTGHSNLQIAKPFLLICAGATFLTSYANIFLVPESFQKFRMYQYNVTNKLSAAVVHPRTFNFIKGVTVYVQNRSIKGELKGVFIHSKGNDLQNSYTITAQTGYIKQDGEQLHLVLLKGIRHEWDKKTKKLSYCAFDNFLYDLTSLVSNKKQYNIKPYERSLRELLNPQFVGGDVILKNRMIAEAHQRLLMPWLCFVNGLILMSVLLFGDLMRRYRKRKIFTAIGICAFFQITLIALINASANHTFLLPIAYSFVIVAMGLFFGLLVYPKRRLFHKG
jgi:lipopolysaccharide export system permease protein